MPEPEDTFPLVSSETLLRSLVGDNTSAEFSVVPPFSHIPGFPLARETVGAFSAPHVAPPPLQRKRGQVEILLSIPQGSPPIEFTPLGTHKAR